MSEETKWCWHCKEYKLLAQFCRDGNDTCCKACRYMLNSSWQKKNREKMRERKMLYMRKWRYKTGQSSNNWDDSAERIATEVTANLMKSLEEKK
jgi:hypothetical protein